MCSGGVFPDAGRVKGILKRGLVPGAMSVPQRLLIRVSTAAGDRGELVWTRIVFLTTQPIFKALNSRVIVS